jgi:hypothetical protein
MQSNSYKGRDIVAGLLVPAFNHLGGLTQLLHGPTEQAGKTFQRCGLFDGSTSMEGMKLPRRGDGHAFAE